MTWSMRMAVPVSVLTLALAGATLPVWGRDKEPLRLVEIKDRPGKELFKAAYGKDGRLGMFYDVDGDGRQEFVSLNRDNGVLELAVLDLSADRERLHVVAGEGSPAGLATVNLDDDARLEFIVASGSRAQENLKKGLILFASTIGAMYWVNVQFAAGANVAWYMIVVPPVNTDLYDIAAFDDDGSPLWRRDFRSGDAAGKWGNTRFQSVVPDPGGAGGTILITDDRQNALIGISTKDGTTRWKRPVTGGAKPSSLRFNPLVDGDRLLPVLYAPEGIIIIDPATGEPVLEKATERRISTLPSYRVLGQDGAKGFLVFGEGSDELRMISLESGEVMWSHTMEKVRDVLPLPDGRRFIAVWKHGIEILDAGGKVLLDRPAPDKIKTVFSPVYRDLNGDGVTEFVFVSGKKIICWNPETDEVLWRTGMGGLVGGANPVGLYDAFYDLDGDGWLDVPVRKGSGSGFWLSGKTGEELASVGNGSNVPVVGDWDGDGKPEVFWYKKWYEVEAR